MSGAQGGSGRLSEADLVRLLEEMISDIEVPGTLGVGRDTEARKHLMAHFIAASADSHPTMH
jgi:hypothetical protein